MPEYSLRTKRISYSPKKVLARIVLAGQNDVLAKLAIGKTPVTSLIADPRFVSNIISMRDLCLKSESRKPSDFAIFRDTLLGPDKVLLSKVQMTSGDRQLISFNQTNTLQEAASIEYSKLSHDDTAFLFHGELMDVRLRQLITRNIVGFVYNLLSFSKETYLLLLQRTSNKFLINGERLAYEIPLQIAEEYKKMGMGQALGEEKYHEVMSLAYSKILSAYGLASMLIRYSDVAKGQLKAYWDNGSGVSFNERLRGYMTSKEDPMAIYQKTLEEDGNYVAIIDKKPNVRKTDWEDDTTLQDQKDKTALRDQGYVPLREATRESRLSKKFIDDMIKAGELIPDKVVMTEHGKKSYYFMGPDAAILRIRNLLGIERNIFTHKEMAKDIFRVHPDIVEAAIERLQKDGKIMELPGENGKKLYRDTDFPEIKRMIQEVVSILGQLEE
jgi:hypothetical protein